jgi:hypothetical protein
MTKKKKAIKMQGNQRYNKDSHSSSPLADAFLNYTRHSINLKRKEDERTRV